jgi:hypothetical protein
LAGDLAADTRLRRRGWLGLHENAYLGAVLVEVLVVVPVLILVIAAAVVGGGGGGGRRRSLVHVPVGIA